jgi:DNA-directed RNA polymerase specialized sigma24 family protein
MRLPPGSELARSSAHRNEPVPVSPVCVTTTSVLLELCAGVRNDVDPETGNKDPKSVSICRASKGSSCNFVVWERRCWRTVFGGRAIGNRFRKVEKWVLNYHLRKTGRQPSRFSLLFKNPAEIRVSARKSTANWLKIARAAGTLFAMETGAAPPTTSLTLWLDRLKAGDRSQAVEQLWQAYFGKLVDLARRHLRTRPRAVADEEDAALSAFDSFVRAAQAGRFPQLNDRNDLWQLLMVITVRKLSDQRVAEACLKRGGGKVIHSLAAEGGIEPGSSEPDPSEAILLAEEAELRLSALDEPQLRQIALWKLAGYSNREVAEKLDRAEPTVERKLRRIREAWQVTN